MRYPWHHRGRDAEPDGSLRPPVSLAGHRIQGRPGGGLTSPMAARQERDITPEPTMQGLSTTCLARHVSVVVFHRPGPRGSCAPARFLALCLHNVCLAPPCCGAAVWGRRRDGCPGDGVHPGLGRTMREHFCGQSGVYHHGAGPPPALRALWQRRDDPDHDRSRDRSFAGLPIPRPRRRRPWLVSLLGLDQLCWLSTLP